MKLITLLILIFFQGSLIKAQLADSEYTSMDLNIGEEKYHIIMKMSKKEKELIQSAQTKEMLPELLEYEGKRYYNPAVTYDTGKIGDINSKKMMAFYFSQKYSFSNKKFPYQNTKNEDDLKEFAQLFYSILGKNDHATLDLKSFYQLNLPNSQVVFESFKNNILSIKIDGIFEIIKAIENTNYPKEIPVKGTIKIRLIKIPVSKPLSEKEKELEIKKNKLAAIRQNIIGNWNIGFGEGRQKKIMLFPNNSFIFHLPSHENKSLSYTGKWHIDEDYLYLDYDKKSRPKQKLKYVDKDHYVIINPDDRTNYWDKIYNKK